MKLRIIKTEEDYQKGLRRLDKIFHAKKGRKEHDELELLGLLIENMKRS